MYLSAVLETVEVDVVRDGEFHSLGLMSHMGRDMLVCLYDAAYLKEMLENSHIACVVTNKEIAEKIPVHLGMAICRDPKVAFYQIHNFLSRETDFYWKDFVSELSTDADIHERAYVSPKNVCIGNDCIIEPNAVILERSILGDGCIVRAGSIIGGVGMEPKIIAGRHVNIPHTGGVRLGDRVEVSGNSYVQRSVFGGFTSIGEDTKIGPLANIGHNVTIGRWCEIAGGNVIAGSSVIGDEVWIGPNATIGSEVHIGNGASVLLGSVVVQNVQAGRKVSGIFAMDHVQALRGRALLGRRGKIN